MHYTEKCRRISNLKYSVYIHSLGILCNVCQSAVAMLREGNEGQGREGRGRAVMQGKERGGIEGNEEGQGKKGRVGGIGWERRPGDGKGRKERGWEGRGREGREGEGLRGEGRKWGKRGGEGRGREEMRGREERVKIGKGSGWMVMERK